MVGVITRRNAVASNIIMRNGNTSRAARRIDNQGVTRVRVTRGVIIAQKRIAQRGVAAANMRMKNCWRHQRGGEHRMAAWLTTYL